MNFFKNRPMLVTVIAILLLVVLIAATSKDRTMTFIESAVGTVITPINTFASKASFTIVNFVERLFKTTDSDLENEQLKIKIQMLEQENAELRRKLEEDEGLRELLNYQELPQASTVVTANIIAKSPGIWFDTFTINAGKNQGVNVDQPVLSADGVVGRISQVGATWAKVTALIDPNFSASVMVQRTRDNCMVRGMLSTGDEADNLELYYLPAGSDIVPGDVIVTNGYGGIFPKGITVGTVSEVTRQSGGEATTANAIVEPAVDFMRLEQVLIITSMELEQTS